MSDDASRRTVVGATDERRSENEHQEGLDFQPSHCNPRPRSRAVSLLTVLSLCTALVGGPVGALAAIVFAWAAQHDPQTSGSRRARILAIVGMTLGFLSTSAWAAIIASAVVSLEKQLRTSDGSRATVDAVSPADPNASRVVSPEGTTVEFFKPVPTKTISRREGLVVVVDMGTLVPSLSEELARERVEAAIHGDLLVVMTTRTSCVACRNFSDTLGHPLMQTALAHVRLVRVDVDVFEEDLSNLKFPHERLPGFFLLAPDLYPRDGIDEEEWGSDAVTNVAPVLGSFVRGKYAMRRRPWQSVAENRLRL